jgi:uncharacterized peroxidase-related enzyme
MADRPTFLGDAPASEPAARLYDEDIASDGYVGNLTRLWASRPEVLEAFTDLRAQLGGGSTLAPRELAVLVTATAATRGDAYCALAWGTRLAAQSDDETAAAVLAGGSPPALSAREAALAEWARAVVRDPNATTAADVERLRAAGLDDREIFEATVFVAFRLAFSTVNDALGAAPDRQLAAEAPEPVRRAVAFGRAPTAE